MEKDTEGIDAGLPAFMQQVRHRIDRRHLSGEHRTELSEIVESLGLDPGRQGLVANLHRTVLEFTAQELSKQVQLDVLARCM